MKLRLLNYAIAILCMSALFTPDVKGSVSPTNCGAPRGLRVASLTYNSAVMSWPAVHGAISYHIQYRRPLSLTWYNATSSTNSFTITGLTPATDFECQIQTICNSGTSPYCQSIKFRTLISQITAPMGVVVNLANQTTAVISWHPVLASCGYIVQWRVSGATTWNTVNNISLATFNLSGLSPCTEYQFRVQTSCQNNLSAFSSIITFKTKCLRTGDLNQQAANNELNESVLVSLYPNPVHEQLKIEYNCSTSGVVNLNIYNIIGNSVMKTTATVNEGLNILSMNTSELSEGIYLLEAENNGILIRRKFMIAK